jgi:hypothetical protein
MEDFDMDDDFEPQARSRSNTWPVRPKVHIEEVASVISRMMRKAQAQFRKIRQLLAPKKAVPEKMLGEIFRMLT